MNDSFFGWFKINDSNKTLLIFFYHGYLAGIYISECTKKILPNYSEECYLYYYLSSTPTTPTYKNYETITYFLSINFFFLSPLYFRMSMFKFYKGLNNIFQLFMSKALAFTFPRTHLLCTCSPLWHLFTNATSTNKSQLLTNERFLTTER